MKKEELMKRVAEAVRLIGIVPRIKRNTEGKSRPTTMALYDCCELVFRSSLKLESEQDELDFVLGCLPIRWRKVIKGESLKSFREHHVRWKKDPADRKKLVPDEVPFEFEGLRNGDVVAMSLGGSGDNFAYALSRRAEEVGALVLRCPPFKLNAYRDALVKANEGDTGLDDSAVLVLMAKFRPADFYPVFVRERNLTWMRECLRRRIDIMKARIACEQRLHQRQVGMVFCNSEGKFPEGSIEKQFDLVKASDAVLNTLLVEEAAANKALMKVCEVLPVFLEVFKQVTGIGPAIAARLISAIQDIRRFETKWQLRKFCGTHCEPDGSFARHKTGQVGGWNPDCRQALYLLGDQFNRRPGTFWGAKLRANKVFYRQAHPVPVEVEIGKGKKIKKYTDGHIHKMALWKTIGEFVEWLFAEWWRLEKANEAGEVFTPSSSAVAFDSVDEPDEISPENPASAGNEGE